MKKRIGEAAEIAAVGMASALALVLSVLKFQLFPWGGSISLVMVPVFWVAFTKGVKAALLSGMIVGIIKVVLSPHVIHPVQFLLDYPLAYSVAALAGFFPCRPVLGVCIGMFSRFFSHFISGVIFFGSFAPPEMSVWKYSMLYNASYIIPETIITIAVLLEFSRRGILSFRPRSELTCLSEKK